MTLKQGKLRGEVVQYPDGVGYCIWTPFPDAEDDSAGFAFDFEGDDLDDLIALLQQMKIAEPEVYKE